MTRPAPGRPAGPPATHQAPVGATIAAPDSSTYARQHRGFFHIDRAARIPATRVGAAAHNVDGDLVNWNSLPLTFLGATSPSTMWTAASAIIDRPKYAQAKRRTLNHNQEDGREKTRVLPAQDTNLKNAFRGPTNGVHLNVGSMTNEQATAESRAPITAGAAFVVHLTGDGPKDWDNLNGRVEHVRSGQSLRFRSAADLVSFMQRVLASCEEPKTV